MKTKTWIWIGVGLLALFVLREETKNISLPGMK